MTREQLKILVKLNEKIDKLEEVMSVLRSKDSYLSTIGGKMHFLDEETTKVLFAACYDKKKMYERKLKDIEIRGVIR